MPFIEGGCTRCEGSGNANYMKGGAFLQCEYCDGKGNVSLCDGIQKDGKRCVYRGIRESKDYDGNKTYFCQIHIKDASIWNDPKRRRCDSGRYRKKRCTRRNFLYV